MMNNSYTNNLLLIWNNYEGCRFIYFPSSSLSLSALFLSLSTDLSLHQEVHTFNLKLMVHTINEVFEEEWGWSKWSCSMSYTDEDQLTAWRRL